MSCYLCHRKEKKSAIHRKESRPAQRQHAHIPSVTVTASTPLKQAVQPTRNKALHQSYLHASILHPRLVAVKETNCPPVSHTPPFRQLKMLHKPAERWIVFTRWMVHIYEIALFQSPLAFRQFWLVECDKKPITSHDDRGWLFFSTSLPLQLSQTVFCTTMQIKNYAWVYFHPTS